MTADGTDTVRALTILDYEVRRSGGTYRERLELQIPDCSFGGGLEQRNGHTTSRFRSLRRRNGRRRRDARPVLTGGTTSAGQLKMYGISEAVHNLDVTGLAEPLVRLSAR